MHTTSALMDATITCHLLDAIDIRCPQSRTSGLPAHAWISPSRSRCHHGMVVRHTVHQKLQARQHRQHPGVTVTMSLLTRMWPVAPYALGRRLQAVICHAVLMSCE